MFQQAHLRHFVFLFLALCLLLFNQSAAFAQDDGAAMKVGNKDCVYADKTYTAGAVITGSNGRKQECINGYWVGGSATPNPVVAGRECLYDGKRYSDGAVITGAGYEQVCIDGRWYVIGKARKNVGLRDIAVNAPGQPCEYGGKRYSDGAVIKNRAGKVIECINGQWF